ncbi:hypothetical protein PLEOSDRAFT_1101138 [Pleurotus ostreatus PC15]|uniref:Uncharacterized protein n=1 Tax=Pleurotus ostreatus (strain PC15) TaxID=1137138 RepID=A0A067P138_PLEO1|nr:hypothetical protein PLEOSDRAFT_1101138 [Pleurotus ostreatus PC15]
MAELYLVRHVPDDECMTILSLKISPRPHAYVAVGGVGGWIKVYKTDNPFECVAWQGPPDSQSPPCDLVTLLWNPTTDNELHAGFSNGDIMTYRFHHRGSVSDYETTVLERDMEDEMQNGSVQHLAMSPDGSVMGAIMHKRILVIHRTSEGVLSKMMAVDSNQSTPWRLGFFEGSGGLVMAAHDPCDRECGLMAVRLSVTESRIILLWQTETRQDYILSFAISPDQSRCAIIYALSGLEIYDTSSGNFLATYTTSLIHPEKNFPVDICFLTSDRFIIGHAGARRIFVSSMVGSRIITENIDLRGARRMKAISRLDGVEFPGGKVTIVAGEGAQAHNGDLAFISSDSSKKALNTSPDSSDREDIPTALPPPPPPTYTASRLLGPTYTRTTAAKRSILLRHPRVVGGFFCIALVYWYGRMTSSQRTTTAEPIACPMGLSVDTSTITETATLTVTKTSSATATITEYTHSPRPTTQGSVYLSMAILIIAPLGGLLLHHQRMTKYISENVPSWVNANYRDLVKVILVGYRSIWGILDDNRGINEPLVEDPTALVPGNLQFELDAVEGVHSY